MRLGHALILLFAAAVLWVGATGPARVQDAPATPVIAVVDLEGILRGSLAAQAARAQLTEISSRYRQEISTEENELRSAEQELQQQRALIAPELFTQRQQELQLRVAELQQKVRGVQRAMDEALAATMTQVQDVLFEEVGWLAQERGINIVLRRSQIVLAANQFDITTDALARLNERLPTVNIEITETPPVAQ